jgi:hypothetical protein
MATFSYTIISDLPPGPTSSSDPALSPDDGTTSVCIPHYKTQAELQEVIDRLVPFEYIEPLKDPGPGYEIIQMFAKVFERVSVAVGRAECSLFIIHSHGGFKAFGTVEFFRPNTSTGSFTLKRGSVVRASETNREFLLVNDLAFGPTDQILQATVEARREDFSHNLEGPVITAGSELLEGEIDELTVPLMDPPFAEPELLVRQAGDTGAGQPAVLDQLGADRSIGRIPDEADDAYRVRIRTLPDTVSPDALKRQLDLIFKPLGLTYDFIETWENDYQACWDGPDDPITNIVFGDYDPHLFVYDDPRTNPPFNNRWMGPEDHVAGIIVVVPDVASFEERGFVFDDSAADPDDHETTFGRRAHSAFDIPTVPLDESITLPSALDAEDTGKNNFYLRISNLLQKIKLGGVFSGVELEGE